MRQPQRGFGLIEIMIALTLGLFILVGVVSVFISAKDTYRKQNRAAALQEDGRFVLSKMIQEIRQVGMFGCLSSITDNSTLLTFTVAQGSPINYVPATGVLTLNTADVGGSVGTPTWTVVSDCLTSAAAYTGTRTPASGQIAFPIRQVNYTYNSTTKVISTNTLGGTVQPLISNVTAFSVMFGLASSSSDTAVSSYSSVITTSNAPLIRTVWLSITLDDGSGQVRAQTFRVVASIRNRLK